MSTRIEGIVDRLTDAETFDSISWILGSGVVTNYAESIIDDHLKANLDFQSKAGLAVTVERVMTGKEPCLFCEKRAGKFSYSDAPDGLWDRHVRCHCYITYDNGSVRQVLGGKDKKWEVISEEVLDGRKKVGMTTTTQRELNARKIVGTEQGVAGAKKNKVIHGETGRALVRHDGMQLYRINAETADIANAVKYEIGRSDGLIINTDNAKLTIDEVESIVRKNAEPPFNAVLISANEKKVLRQIAIR